MRCRWDAVACLLCALLEGTCEEGGGVNEDGITEAADARRSLRSVLSVLNNAAGLTGDAGASVEGKLGSDAEIDAATLSTTVVSCGVVG